MEGALTKGCPKDDAVAIWDMIESGGSYLFNKCIAGYETNPLAELSQCILDSSNGSIINVI